MEKILYTLLGIVVIGCGQQRDKSAGNAKSDPMNMKPRVVPVTELVPLKRDTVKKEPVAEYRVKTDDPLNDWYFQVRLYETPKTFHYLIRLQFEEIRGEDTLKLPNFGTMPQPVIKKGPEQYSCIIGFMDKDNQFREYKKVFVKGDQLKIVALRHYGVSRYQQ